VRLRAGLVVCKNLVPTGIRSPDRPAAITTELPGPLLSIAARFIGEVALTI
jgi:hypothetical protein